MSTPKYRADIKGEVANYIADFEATCRGEIEQGDSFVFTWQDCEDAVREYSDYLTEREMKAAFERARRPRAVELAGACW